MISLRADTLNGKPILRPVENGSVQRGVVFPPSISVTRPAPVMIEELVEQSLAQLVSVSDQTADPVIKAQAVKFQAQLKRHQTIWLTRAALNERSHMIEHLERLGMTDAAKALRNG